MTTIPKRAAHGFSKYLPFLNNVLTFFLARTLPKASTLLLTSYIGVRAFAATGFPATSLVQRFSRSRRQVEIASIGARRARAEAKRLSA